MHKKQCATAGNMNRNALMYDAAGGWRLSGNFRAFLSSYIFSFLGEFHASFFLVAQKSGNGASLSVVLRTVSLRVLAELLLPATVSGSSFSGSNTLSRASRSIFLTSQQLCLSACCARTIPASVASSLVHQQPSTVSPALPCCWVYTFSGSLRFSTHLSSAPVNSKGPGCLAGDMGSSPVSRRINLLWTLQVYSCAVQCSFRALFLFLPPN